MQFLKIQPRPGLHTDGTAYTAEGTWQDVDKVRFRKGFVEKIRGWVKFLNDGFVGSCRKIHNWAVNDGDVYLAIGTHLKLYQFKTTAGGQTATTYTDITPIRDTGTITDIAVTEDSSVVVVTDGDHGAVAGDYVTISGVGSDIGGIAAATFNAEHKITALGDTSGSNTTSKYCIQLDGSKGGSTANTDPTATAQYQINIGSDTLSDATAGTVTGWNISTWGSGPWGGGFTQAEDGLRIWSLDNFGDDLIANVRSNAIYYWDESAGGRATLLNDLTRKTRTISNGSESATLGISRTSDVITVNDNGHGASVGDTVTISGAGNASLDGTHTVASANTLNTFTISSTGSNVSDTYGVITYSAGKINCPTASLAALTSERARHLIAFGCNPLGSNTTIDRTLVRWSSSENPAEWLPLATNSAGSQTLSSCSRIIGVLRTRNETLIWTDVSVVSMRYTGPPFYFSFNDVGRGMSLISPDAMANADGVVYFMDRGGFYRYSGGVQRLMCPVLSTVFDDFNYDEAFRVVCGTNLDYSEVIWFYPSAGSIENNRYVIYNYAEDLWYFGSLDRGAWDNATLRTYPQAATVHKLNLAGNPVSIASNTTVTIALPSGHGLPNGETVKIILSGLTTVGNITNLMLNTEHSATVSGDTVTFNVGTTATSTATGGGTVGTMLWENYIYNHENGWNGDGEAITSYIETGDFDVGEGDRFMSLSRLIPDLKFIDSSGTVTIKMKGRNFPLKDLTELSTSSFQEGDTQGHIRARARQAVMRVESSNPGFGWRLGYVRLDARPDGKR